MDRSEEPEGGKDEWMNGCMEGWTDDSDRNQQISKKQGCMDLVTPEIHLIYSW